MVKSGFVGTTKSQLTLCLRLTSTPCPNLTICSQPCLGGQWFTKIELTHAYQKMSLKESSRELVTVNTRRGLYCYTRLPFGVASAPALFQQTMDTVLYKAC